jgi:ATP-dependent exoDNAse (exonuclease V) alpha subunit
MVSSKQMALFVEAVTRAGAKLVLVGDPEQLQPIEAGAAFRAIADRIGYAELETIYRQREQWMRDASLDLARGNIAKASSLSGKRQDDRRQPEGKPSKTSSPIGTAITIRPSPR